MELPQMSIRRLMIAVLATSVLLATVRLVNVLKYWTFLYGWNTSVLNVGDRVTVCGCVLAGGEPVASGTGGIVVDDPPDEDSAYPNRKVSIQIIEGPRKGAICEAERSNLRVVGWF
jgi:hypothetical protein